ncbi:MAG: SWIM zinc finger family protein, partial [Bifidobacteriaceae bacterium]|nr:SWIM zinc finger family protein [Bifidobacteriaceae bacterium]
MPFSSFPVVDAVDLRRQVGNLTFGRGHDYFRRGLVLPASIEYDPLDLRLSGRVRGTRPTPYDCRIWLEPTGDGSVVETESGLCSCPVGFDCKHIVALVLAANARALTVGGAAEPPTARWRQQLATLATAVRAGSDQPHLAPVALQFRASERSRWSNRSHLEMRAAKPGKRGGWVANTELRWASVAWYPPGVSLVQARWFSDLAKLAYQGYGATAWLSLGAVESDAVWPHLARADSLGIALVGERATDSIELVDLVEPAVDVRQHEAGLHLSAVLRVGGAGGEILAGVPTGVMGSSGYWAIVPVNNGRRLLLGPGAKPGRAGSLAKSALDASLPLDIPAGQAPDFWERIYPGLALALPFVSVDGSVELPEPVRAALHLRIGLPRPTQADLTWSWRYGADQDTGPKTGSPTESAPVDTAGVELPPAETRSEGTAGAPPRVFSGTPSAAEFPTDSATRPEGRWDSSGEDQILAGVESVRFASHAFTDPRQASHQVLAGSALARFAGTALPALRRVSGLTIEGDLSHIKVRTDLPVVKLKASSSSDGDWFDLGGTV